MRPLISIILPTYNRAYLLPRSIRSVLYQTFANFELIIVDDGSTDATKEIVQRFQKKDQRVIYFFQENSGMVAKPLNLGLRKARGRYITFQASDDEWTPSYLEKQIALLDSSRGRRVDITSCSILEVDQNGKSLRVASKPRSTDNDYIMQTSLVTNYIFGNILVRREVVDRVGFFDESLKIREDFDFWIRLAKAGFSFGFVYEPLYIIHRHAHGTISTAVDPEEQISMTRYLLEKHKDVYERFPAGYAKALRNLGTFYLLIRDIKNARSCFLDAIRARPSSPRAYLNLLLSLFGGKGYLFFFRVKRRMFPFAY